MEGKLKMKFYNSAGQGLQPLLGQYTFSIFCFVPHKILEESLAEWVPPIPHPFMMFI